MTRFIKVLAGTVLALGITTQSFAAGVFLVGDSNIFTTQEDNEILFQNIFNGQNVFNDTSYSLAGLSTTANVTNGMISSANLTGQDFLITGCCRTTYSNPERTTIVDFVNGGGSLFLIGEYNPNRTDTNIAVNQLLTDLGSTMSLSLTDNLIGAGPVVLDSVTNSTVFGAGVDSWYTEGAAVLILLGLNGEAVVSGRDPRICNPDGLPNCEGVGSLGAVVAYDALSPIPVPAAVWLFGTALIGLLGLQKRRQVA